MGDPDHAAAVLRAVGYYRLTGYLYPFREPEQYADEEGRARIRMLSGYRAGTRLDHAEGIIDFDRKLRMLVMDGVERIEVAVRMQMGHVLGRTSPFAHEDPACFEEVFVKVPVNAETGEPESSSHARWLARAADSQAKSDEQFVVHFRQKYDGRMPIWALTELLELGQLSTLYRALRQQDAEEIAHAFGVPSKKIMVSWLASLNYVRNVAAHHARLYNRNLQNAPARPKVGLIPVLDHLRENRAVESAFGTYTAVKAVFGTYNALAVIAYILRSIEERTDWRERVVALLQAFPTSHALSLASTGVPETWKSLDLWR